MHGGEESGVEARSVGAVTIGRDAGPRPASTSSSQQRCAAAAGECPALSPASGALDVVAAAAAARPQLPDRRAPVISRSQQQIADSLRRRV